MCKENLIKSDLVFIMQNVKSRQEILEHMANRLMDEGYVKESFKKAIIEREEIYSTGLPIGDIGVAIPHTDRVHVKKSIISIATLSHSVEFLEMGNPNKIVDVDIIFMLAIKEGDSHIDVLTDLMSIIQDGMILDKISRSNEKEVALLLNEKLHNLKDLRANHI